MSDAPSRLAGMSNEDESNWFYASPESLAGMVQRGRGRGAIRALTDPDGPALVHACVARDYRWMWALDEREVYLARLVRDLGLSTAPIVEQMWAAGRVASSFDNTFELAVGVLAVLACAGVGDSREQLRRYVREGQAWHEALTQLAHLCPEQWDELDLFDIAASRLSDADVDQIALRSQPWTTWAERDEHLAGIVATARERFKRRRRPRPYADAAQNTLFDLLRRQDAAVADKRGALLELARREPDPALLEIVDDLVAGNAPVPLVGLRRAVERLGAVAVDPARRWAAAGAPFSSLGLRILSEHGDENDIPVLLAGFDRQVKNREWDGLGRLADAFARIGSDVAGAATLRLTWAWRTTPRSGERAAFLKGLTIFNPWDADRPLSEALYDCESSVRRYAVELAPLTGANRERIRRLSTDPMETQEIRAAATTRLAKTDPVPSDGSPTESSSLCRDSEGVAPRPVACDGVSAPGRGVGRVE